MLAIGLLEHMHVYLTSLGHLLHFVEFDTSFSSTKRGS